MREEGFLADRLKFEPIYIFDKAVMKFCKGVFKGGVKDERNGL